jgi:hypothetical protein
MKVRRWKKEQSHLAQRFHKTSFFGWLLTVDTLRVMGATFKPAVLEPSIQLPYKQSNFISHGLWRDFLQVRVKRLAVSCCIRLYDAVDLVLVQREFYAIPGYSNCTDVSNCCFPDSIESIGCNYLSPRYSIECRKRSSGLRCPTFNVNKNERCRFNSYCLN